MRDVEQEVARRDDAEATERLRTHGADAFQIGDWRVEEQARPSGAGGHQSLNNARENSVASKGSRSSAASPTPRNFTGTSIASCTATTTPPRAVPSSFVTTSPVTGTAAANVFACCTAFCPMVP